MGIRRVLWALPRTSLTRLDLHIHLQGYNEYDPLTSCKVTHDDLNVLALRLPATLRQLVNNVNPKRYLHAENVADPWVFADQSRVPWIEELPRGLHNLELLGLTMTDHAVMELMERMPAHAGRRMRLVVEEQLVSEIALMLLRPKFDVELGLCAGQFRTLALALALPVSLIVSVPVACTFSTPPVVAPLVQPSFSTQWVGSPHAAATLALAESSAWPVQEPAPGSSHKSRVESEPIHDTAVAVACEPPSAAFQILVFVASLTDSIDQAHASQEPIASEAPSSLSGPVSDA
ncbi:hypothetical protein GGF32_001995 [Allomyces javanicus]|nr:hypothetical protein GGF32_001995 [Allomyces javanicus]